MDTRWRIELFGTLRVQCGDRTVTHFKTRKTAALLACLALSPHRTHSREELAEQLWPDEDPDATRNRFKQALSTLRRALEPDDVSAGTLLIADRAEVRLDTSRVVVDVVEFEAALRAAVRTNDSSDRARLLRTAVDLYRGDLLPGYYEDMILAERERLSQMLPGALGRLASVLAEIGDMDEALEHARRAVGVDPLREESHALLIRLYGRAGRIAEALRQYRELEQTLQEELDAAPSAPLRALIEQVRAGESAPRPLPPLETVAPCASRPQTPDPHPQESRAAEAPPADRPQIRWKMPLTRFFGREEEITRLLEMLHPAPLPSALNSRERFSPLFHRVGEQRGERATPLITLTGPGGSGKTRLALELVARVAAAPGRTVWFAPLADVTEARLIVESIAGVMDLERRSSVDRTEQVCAALAGRPVLLALDNFEQLAEEGAGLVRLLLERVPSLTCLVTSRQRLGIAGEWEFPVAPLPTPLHAGTPERLLEFASVQLFVDRAQAARADFALTRANAEAVAALCHRLEGLPLALELAAAWSSVLTPMQIQARLTRRFDLLVSRRNDSESRHQSLHAAITWSYRLLGEDLRRLFVCLSVFRGSWTLEAAEAVCEEPLALDYLAQLRDRSLVVAETAGLEMRYRLLETLREYAEAQIASEARRELERRHVRYFTELAESIAPYWEGSEQGVWLDRLEAEYDNLREALAYLRADTAGVEMGLRLTGCLWRFWYMRGHVSEGRQYLAEILARDTGGVPTAPRARALGGAGTLAWSQGDLTATQSYQEQCLAAWQALGDRRGIASALGNLALALDERGDRAGARTLYEESLEIMRALGDRRGIGIMLNNLGVLAHSMSDTDTALAYFEESLVLKRETGDQRGVSVALNNLGLLREDKGDLDAARAMQEESLAIKREIGDKRGIASSLQNLGALARRQEDTAEALRLVEESLAIKRELGDKRGITSSLNILAALACARGEMALAHSQLEESLAILQELGDGQFIVNTLWGFANLASTEGQPARAAHLLAAIESIRIALGTSLREADRHDYDRTLAAVRMSLDPDTLAAAWEAASAMTLEQAVAYALQTPVASEPGRLER
jgi:predicted ATPase/DNA-binding SARP family transcriptional activator